MAMSQTQKNSLKIGGALIVIALLLVCGPLSGRFGQGDKVEETPPVAAAPPPVDASDAIDAAAAGALVGATLEEPDRSAESFAGEEELAPVVAGAAVAGAAAGTAASDSGSSAAKPSSVPAPAPTPPPVSAGVPVADSGPPPFDDDAAKAKFDTEFGGAPSLMAANDFPLPVDAAGPSGPATPFDFPGTDIPRPCDTVGAGCRVNAAFVGVPVGGGGVTPFGGGNPRGTP